MMGIILPSAWTSRARFAGLLMITTAQTASIWNVGIKTAAAQNMVAIGFIEKTLQETITWPEWLSPAAPFVDPHVDRALLHHDAHDAARDGGGGGRPRGDPQAARRRSGR